MILSAGPHLLRFTHLSNFPLFHIHKPPRLMEWRSWSKRSSLFCSKERAVEWGRESLSLSWCLHSLSQGHYERSRTARGADNVSPMELSHPASCLTQNLTIAPQAQSVFLTRAPDCTRRLRAGLVLTHTAARCYCEWEAAAPRRFPRQPVWCWHSSMVYCSHPAYRAHQYSEGTNLPGEALQFMSKVLVSS